MAEVWSARLPGTHGGHDQFVAIKLLASHLSERAEYREMFLGEARLSMMLSHPNIVQVFDAVAHDSDCYMVMELISGMTLSQLERNIGRVRGALPLVVTVYIVGELLRALSYAHQVRTDEGSVIVHRDVSPQNVMVTSAGEVKLMDFGIARFATQETQGSFVKGKLQYMPPEQLRKQTRKPTVDLYAVGAILHELVDGKRFRGRLDQAALLNMVMHGEIPALRDPNSLPGPLDLVRRGLLEPEESARIQTARKALGMLCRWPEYRESSAELRELVMRFVEPAAARAVPEGSKVSSVPEGSFSGFGGLDYGSDSNLHATAGSSQTEPTGSELTASDDLEPLSASDVMPIGTPASGPRRRALPLVLAGLGVAAVLGLGLIVVVGGADQAADEGAAAPPDSAPPDAEPPAPEHDSKPEPNAGSAGAQPADAGQRPEPDEGEEGEEGDDQDELASGPERATRVSVPVEFVANEFFFVYVKVNGKVLTLEPRARLELPDGRHTVFLRQSTDEKWVRAGRITVEPGKEYRVEMRKPSALKLVKK